MDQIDRTRRRYRRAEASLPMAELIRGMGVNVDVIDERSLSELLRLRDGDELRKNYDAVWLASFDSLGKLLDHSEAQSLRAAIGKGTGFIHTGGRGSFYGGFGEGACLDLTPLTDVLPVEIQERYDLVFDQPHEPTEMFSKFPPMKDILRSAAADPAWSDGGLAEFGLSGFNNTQLKAGASEILRVKAVHCGLSEATDKGAPWLSRALLPHTPNDTQSGMRR